MDCVEHVLRDWEVRDGYMLLSHVDPKFFPQDRFDMRIGNQVVLHRLYERQKRRIWMGKTAMQSFVQGQTVVLYRHSDRTFVMKVKDEAKISK